MNPIKRLSIIIPVFNEEKNLRTFLKRIDILSNGLDDMNIIYELIFIDDSSSDRSHYILRSYDKYTVFSNDHNSGYGKTIKNGFRESKYENIGIIPSDNQFDPVDLLEVINKWDGKNIIATYRKRRKDPLFRKILSKAYRLILFLKGLHIKDPNWVKIFPKDLTKDLKTEGPLIDAEILFNAKKDNIEIINIPVQHYPRKYEKAKGFSFGVLLLGLRDLYLVFHKKD